MSKYETFMNMHEPVYHSPEFKCPEGMSLLDYMDQYDKEDKAAKKAWKKAVKEYEAALEEAKKELGM